MTKMLKKFIYLRPSSRLFNGFIYFIIFVFRIRHSSVESMYKGTV